MHIGPKLIRAAVLPSALLFIIANASPAPHGDHHHETKPEFNVSVVSSSPHMPPATGHQDSHSHSHSHAAPLLEYNETQVLGGHAPDPLAYISYDLGVRTGVRSGSGPDAFDVLEYHGASHGWLMALHVSCMILGFFIALPMSESKR
ncbi:hypothetical protein FRC02_011610 [Tulasnella sp. 418]|nr:hypothetical protein FRC02_011610 [Tulasnella sp. 418]